MSWVLPYADVYYMVQSSTTLWLSTILCIFVLPCAGVYYPVQVSVI